MNIGDNPYLQVRQQNTPEERFVYLYAIHNYYPENHKSRSLDHGFLDNVSLYTAIVGWFPLEVLTATALSNPILNKMGLDDVVHVKHKSLLIIYFAKTFHKVLHKRLIYKLNYYRKSSQVSHSVQSFLENTNVRENVTSEKMPDTFGVAQGTNLGSILFLTYINNILGYHKHNVRLFAEANFIYKTNTFTQTV